MELVRLEPNAKVERAAGTAWYEGAPENVQSCIDRIGLLG